MTTTAEITFPQPHEIAGYWDWDKIHAPKPLTPLAGDAVVNSMVKASPSPNTASALFSHCTVAW